MIGASGLADWLKAEGVDEAYVTNGHIPPAPDRLVIVTFTGGPGELRERTFDALSFQIRTRGKQRIDGDGEALAWEVDDVLMGAVPPVSIGGVRVIRIVRSGGPPGFMERDAGGRTHAACSYIFEAARTTF